MYFLFYFVAINLIKAHFDRLYNACVVSCPTGDFACNGNCFREYTSNLELCPCQSGCPHGCPCDVYQCPGTTTSSSTTTTTTTALTTTSITTTTTTKAPLQATEVLVLNTYSNNVPIITNAAGRQDTDFDFAFGEGTEVVCSCSMTWKNELYIFGGGREMRQISKLVGCQLTKVGELDFDHYWGACANVADAKLYLCFNDNLGDLNKCRVATSPTSVLEEINQSSYDHRWTRIAASEGNIL